MTKRIFILTFIMLTFSVFADQSQSLKNMKKRLPQIVSLKKSKAVGENNKGYLTALKASANTVVAAENKDRLVIYTAVAKKVNTSVDNVGKTRAKQIAKKAEPGTMLQDGAGKWYEK